MDNNGMPAFTAASSEIVEKAIDTKRESIEAIRTNMAKCKHTWAAVHVMCCQTLNALDTYMLPEKETFEQLQDACITLTAQILGSVIGMEKLLTIISVLRLVDDIDMTERLKAEK